MTGRGAQLQPGAPPAPSPWGSPRPGSGRGRDSGPLDQAGRFALRAKRVGADLGLCLKRSVALGSLEG